MDMSDNVNRRRFLKSSLGAAIATPFIGTVSANQRDGTLADYRRAFQKYTRQFGQPEFDRQFVKSEGEILQESSDVSTADLSLAQAQDNAIVDLVTFGDEVTREATFCRTGPDAMKIRFDGDVYEVEITDRLRQSLEQKTAMTMQMGRARARMESRDRPSVSSLVEVGEDVTFDTYDASETNGVDFWEGAARSHQYVSSREPEANAEVYGLVGSSPYIKAEMWKSIEFTGGSDTLRLHCEGEYKGTASAALAGGRAYGNIFVREKDNHGDLGEFERPLSWSFEWGKGKSAHRNYDETVFAPVDSKEYEIGLRLELAITTISESAALIDFCRDGGDKFTLKGFMDYAYMDLEWT